MSAVAHKRTSVAPNNTLILMKSLGPTRAAKALGVSTTTLYKARSTGEVSKVLEIAAEGALGGTLGHALANEAANDKHAPAKAPAQDMAICLVEVPRPKLMLVEKLVRAIGARCITD